MDGAKGLLECVEGPPRSLGRRIELRKPGPCPRDLQLAIVPLATHWKEGVPVGGNALVRKAFSDDCGLLREWAGSNAPIFFDLGEKERLWWLFAKNTNGSAYVAPYPRAEFIECHRSTATEEARQFDEFVNDIPQLIAEYESHRRAQPFRQDPLQPRTFRRRFRL